MNGTGDRPIIGNNTQVFNDKGHEITGITKIDISIGLNEIVTATVEVMVSCDSDMDNVHALLGTKTLADVLRLHGIDNEIIDDQRLGDKHHRYVLGTRLLKEASETVLGLPALGSKWTHKASERKVKVIYQDNEQGGVVVEKMPGIRYGIWDKSDYLFCKLSDLIEVA
jgi:hypothetical protein